MLVPVGCCVCFWVAVAGPYDLLLRRPIGAGGGGDRASGAGPSDVVAVTLTEPLQQHGML